MDKNSSKGVELYSDVDFHHKFPLQLRFSMLTSSDISTIRFISSIMIQPRWTISLALAFLATSVT